MRGFREFWDDYVWTVHADPLQHLITLLTGAAAMGLVWVFWAAVRGML